MVAASFMLDAIPLSFAKPENADAAVVDVGREEPAGANRLTTRSMRPLWPAPIFLLTVFFSEARRQALIRRISCRQSTPRD